MKKRTSLFLIISIITGMFATSAFASYDSRGAEFVDHSLIELISANGQIGTVRVSNDDSNLVIETRLWPPNAKLMEYHLSVANDISGFTGGPGVAPQNGQIAISKTFSSATQSTIDKFSYANLNSNLIVLTVYAVIQDPNGQPVNVWARGLPMTGSNWTQYFEYAKRVDTTPPQATIDVDNPVLTPPDHRMVSIHVSINASDNFGKDVTIQLKSITSNEPDQGLGLFDKPNDIQFADFGTNDTVFSLRAESSIKGHGRVYTITYTLTDNAGNSSDVTTTVKVPPINLEYIKAQLREEAAKLCVLLQKFGYFGTMDIALKMEQYIHAYTDKQLVVSFGEHD